MRAEQVIREILKREPNASVCVDIVRWSHKGPPRQQKTTCSIWLDINHRLYEGATYQECFDKYLSACSSTGKSN